MWRCYRCETFNNQDYCFICGLAANAPHPVKNSKSKGEDAQKKKTKTNTDPLFMFGKMDDETDYGFEEKGKVSPLVIAVVLLLALAILYVWSIGGM